MRPASLAVAAIAILGGCAVRQLARTVGAGRAEVALLVGGPLQSSATGFAAPVPEHRIQVRGGLSDDLDLTGGFAIAPLFSSILALDLGFVAQIVRRARFAAAGSIRLNCLHDLDDGFRGTYYPEFGLHMEHRFEPRLALVFGSHALLQASPSAPHRPSLFFAPYLGTEVVLGEHALSLSLAWINPWQSERTTIRWEPAGAGAIVVTFGWRVQPGGVR